MSEHDARATAGRMEAGDSVLVHAVASGVGTQAVQLARETRRRRRTLDMEELARKRLEIIGTTFRTRTVEE